MVKVAINGFGRIGRNVLRSAVKQGVFGKEFDIVAVNDLTDAKTLAHLLKYDSVHGKFDGTIAVEGNDLVVNGKRIKILAEKDPEKLPWASMGVGVVIESTGFFTDDIGAGKHLKAGAKKVVISAPAKGAVRTVVIGVNEREYDRGKDNIISMASCTTNSLAPVVKVINDKLGIRKGFMTTVHSYTNDQKILDLPHKDLRRGRAAAVSIIPTTTGAAKALGEVIPEIKGKMDGLSLRVPTPDGSITDMTLEVSRETTKEEVNAILKEAADGPLKGVIEYSEEPLVSIDIIGNPHPAIVDSLSTMAIGTQIKVLSWYDNEWGYSSQLVKLVTKIL
ncbi:D-erythrose-4-phosphate dehydrogenase [Candidatus Gugararchaeum adminiculabundum]|nr:D-erythrose-4-phosphate dehydrogenase [Candidatus Gugararchaeum adminiculabundum]